ncbi:MAG TPA: PDGLE domain-containing protein [Tepidiformaceae bacterium]|nr:PDGLE domain-containing protein [Tepidiformaceae bacterium]
MTEAPSSQSFFRRWWWVIAGLIIACAVVLVLAPAASGDPDGLDRVSEDKEFAEQGKDPAYEWLPDYTVPGIDNEYATLIIAGLIGVFLTFGVTIGFGALLRASRRGSVT